MNLHEFEGSHFDVGRAMGRAFGDRIARVLTEYAPLRETVLPYYATPAGQARYDRLWAMHRERCPDYLAEMEGMAAGAEQPFERLFLMTFRLEFARYRAEDEDLGCTTVCVANGTTALIGHNEDGPAVLADSIALVRVAVPGKPVFTAAIYPGTLAGNAFGFNSQGVCFCVNQLRPKAIREGIGREFVTRSLLDAVSVEDAVRRVTVADRAYGHNYAIGSFADRRLLVVETSPTQCDCREVAGAYFHANEYIEIGGVDAVPNASSLARQERGGTLLAAAPPRDREGVLGILRDRRGPYPILRSATPPDPNLTALTALFDLDAATLSIYDGGRADTLVPVTAFRVEYPYGMEGETT
jgi:hypothetical protein